VLIGHIPACGVEVSRWVDYCTMPCVVGHNIRARPCHMVKQACTDLNNENIVLHIIHVTVGPSVDLDSGRIEVVSQTLRIAAKKGKSYLRILSG